MNFGIVYAAVDFAVDYNIGAIITCKTVGAYRARLNYHEVLPHINSDREKLTISEGQR